MNECHDCGEDTCCCLDPEDTEPEDEQLEEAA